MGSRDRGIECIKLAIGIYERFKPDSPAIASNYVGLAAIHVRAKDYGPALEAAKMGLAHLRTRFRTIIHRWNSITQ